MDLSSINNSLTLINSNIHSVLDIEIILIILIMVAVLLITSIMWIFFAKRTIIMPFETGNLKDKLDGTALSNLLLANICRICQILKRHNELPPSNPRVLSTFQPEIKSDAVDSPSTNSALYKKTWLQAGSLFDVPNLDVFGNMPDIGTLGVGTTSISITQLANYFRMINSEIITGCIQKFGSSMSVVASLKYSNHSISWFKDRNYSIEIFFDNNKNNTQMLNRDQRDIDNIREEQVHDLIKDLSFCIFFELSRLHQSDLFIPNWEALKNITDALDHYYKYRIEGNMQDLDESIQGIFQAFNSIKILEFNEGYHIICSLLIVLAFDNLKTKDNAKEKNYSISLECSNKAIELDHSNVAAWNCKGLALYFLDRFDEAIQAYCKAIEINPMLADAWYNKGIVLEQIGKFNAAIQAFDEAIKINPVLADAFNNKGSALHYLGRYNESIQSYDNAIKINPKYTLALNNKGLVLHDLCMYEGAIQSFDSAINIDPKFAYAWNNKGNAFAAQKKYDEAIAYYDQAIKINPQLADVVNNKANALAAQKRYDEAIAYYDQAIKLNPKEALPRYNKGLILFSLGNYKEATQEFDCATKIDPKLAVAWYYKGKSLEEQNKYEDAIQASKIATEIDPKFVDAWWSQGKILSKLGRSNESQQAYEAAKELSKRR